MESELWEQCRSRVQQTLVNRGWQLVGNEAGFLDEVRVEVETRLALARSRSLESIVEHATIRRYNQMWYEACRAQGTPRQYRAFEEMHASLYRVAFHRLDYDRERAQECTQATLVKIWQNLDRVEDPDSFLWWALRILTNEINKHLTAGKRRKTDRLTGETIWQDVEVSLIDLQPDVHFEEERVEYPEILVRLDGMPMEQAPVLTEDMRAKIEAAVRLCLNNERHQAVIIKIFLDDKSRQEVAEELGTTPQIVSVFKQRAVKRLQGCEDFLAVLEELL